MCLSDVTYPRGGERERERKWKNERVGEWRKVSSKGMKCFKRVYRRQIDTKSTRRKEGVDGKGSEGGDKGRNAS